MEKILIISNGPISPELEHRIKELADNNVLITSNALPYKLQEKEERLITMAHISSSYSKRQRRSDNNQYKNRSNHHSNKL